MAAKTHPRLPGKPSVVVHARKVLADGTYFAHIRARQEAARTITIDVLMGGVLTGAAMNPARAFGPQLVGHHWAHWWIWYVGPFAGGVIAASVYEMLYLRPSAAADTAAS